MNATKLPGLGDRVKDRVTGFKGIVLAVTEWLNGCRRLGVCPEKLHDGKPAETQWFDAPQCDVVEARVHIPFTEVPAPAPRPARGGPQKDPSARRAGE